MASCTNCGKHGDTGDEFCRFCGTPTHKEAFDVVYGIEGRTSRQRDDLTAILVNDGIPYEWHGTDLTVPSQHEQRVDEILTLTPLEIPPDILEVTAIRNKTDSLGINRLIVVRSLWLVALALFAGTAWFAFRGTIVMESIQVTPDVLHRTQFIQPCPADLTTFECQVQQAMTPFTRWHSPGTSASVVFACSTVWDRWTETAPAQASDGTTYSSLAETRTPSNHGQLWYGNVDSALNGANSACTNNEQGRLHLFWTLLASGALVLVVSEFVRRSVAG